MYKASVLMPAYNDARYIRDAIDSILGQTFTDFELIIVNDGSTDETPQILASYTDPRIRILYHPTNMGRAHARNTALNAAQGEYVLWMDADDISLPQRLEKQIKFMDANPDICVVGGNVQCFHGSDKLLTFDQGHTAIKTNLLFTSTIPNPASCLRLSTIRRLKNVAYDPKLARAQDYDFWCQLLLDNNVRATNLPDTLLLYRVTIFSDKKYHTEVQRRILKRLGMDADTNLVQLCFNLGINNCEKIAIKDVNAYHDLVIKIIEANKKTHVFDQPALEQRVYSRLAARIIHVQAGHCLRFRLLTKKLGYKYTIICGLNFLKKRLKKCICLKLNDK